MDWITEDVAIGNYLEAQDADLLSRERIGSVLGLTRTLEGTTASGLKIKEIVIVLLEDALGNDLRLFEKALDALTRLAADAGPVLVHCHAGRSRSVVVVARYLMRSL